MRRPALLLALTALLIAAADGGKDDLDRFQGTWKMESLEVGGEKAAREVVKGGLMIFERNEYTQKQDDEVIERGKFTLDSSKTPKRLDFDITEGPEQGRHQLGIYELTGDTLKVCVVPPGAKERPSEFATKPGTMTGLVVFKREKPKGVPTCR